MKSIRSCLIACMFLPLAGMSQSVTGYWYGSAFITGAKGDQNSYMIELILTENGRSVQGIMNYYFLNLYRSIPISATFDKSQQALTFTDVPFVFHGSNPLMAVDCFMSGRFNLVIARAGTSLNGQWKPNEEYKNTCPPIQARLNLDKEQSISDSMALAIRNTKSNYQFWTAPASAKEEITAKNMTATNKQPAIKDTAVLKTTAPSREVNSAPPAASAKKSPTAKKQNPIKKLFALLKKKISKKERTSTVDRTSSAESTAGNKYLQIDPSLRAIEVYQELEVDMDSVRISLYDNGEMDGDSISIFFNNKRIVSNQLLSSRPIEFSIPLDSLVEYVELVMVAENLGSIPPNTAIMKVEAGEKKYQLLLSSSLEKSASVRIKRKRKGLRIN